MKFGTKNYVGLIKFGEKQHMDALYNEGLLYLNTFSYFKNQSSLDLLLFVPDENKRLAILKDFEYYNIEYEISLKK